MAVAVAHTWEWVVELSQYRCYGCNEVRQLDRVSILDEQLVEAWSKEFEEQEVELETA